MINLDEVFDDHYMRQRRYLAWRGPVVARAIYDGCGLREGSTVVDVGCAVGDIAAALLELGVDAWGVDGSRAGWRHHVLGDDRFIVMDLRGACGFERKFDLLLCFEVMPFIEAEYVETFLKNLSRMSDSLLVGRISAVPGYVEVPEVANRVRTGLDHVASRPAMKAIYNSVRYFEREAT